MRWESIRRHAALLAKILIFVLLAIVELAPTAKGAHWKGVVQDFGHGPIFGLIALLILVSIRADRRGRELSWPASYAFAFVLAVLLGMLAELIQMPIGRDASWFDVRSDALGAAGFLGLCAALAGHVRTTPLRILAGAAGVALLVLHSMPLVETTMAYARRAAVYPRLNVFERTSDLYFIRPQSVAANIDSVPVPWAVHAGEKALHVKFDDQPGPGIYFYEPSPDWRGHRALTLDIVNPTDRELVMQFRARDFIWRPGGKRFDADMRVPPRSRQQFRYPFADIVKAPGDRPMDLGRMADYVIFRHGEAKAPEMYLVSIGLE